MVSNKFPAKAHLAKHTVLRLRITAYIPNLEQNGEIKKAFNTLVSITTFSQSIISANKKKKIRKSSTLVSNFRWRQSSEQLIPEWGRDAEALILDPEMMIQMIFLHTTNTEFVIPVPIFSRTKDKWLFKSVFLNPVLPWTLRSWLWIIVSDLHN